MKKIIIFTMGTRGDVQPYIYLAQALLKEGYIVIIGTHPCWRELVMDAGVKFVSVGPDIDIEYEAAVIRGKYKNPMLSMLKTMKFVLNIIQNTTSDIYENCKGKDLVIVSHSQMGATEAEVLRIKTINVTLQTEMIPQSKKPQNLKDKILKAVINPQMTKPYNKIRKMYDLPPVKSMDMIMSKMLNLIPISCYVTPPNPYWEDKNKIVGYWFVNDDNYRPSEELKAFLGAGSKPIILALGAMSFESKEEKEKLYIFINAFNKTGKRAIIQGFNKTLAENQLPDTIFRIGSVPHSWLFKQGYCVIHHCGFGTSAASMIYGIPSIPIPHLLDQFAFAEKIYRLKVGVKPIKVSELDTEKLISAIKELDADYEEIVDCVSDLSSRIIEEDGLKVSVNLINEIIQNNWI